MATAIKAALKSNMKMRHGAVITDGSKIVSIGSNQRIKHLRNKHSIHAEESAIKNLHKRHKNAQTATRSLHLYVLRLLDNGSFANSFPCQKCQLCICNASNISQVFYSDPSCV